MGFVLMVLSYEMSSPVYIHFFNSPLYQDMVAGILVTALCPVSISPIFHVVPLETALFQTSKELQLSCGPALLRFAQSAQSVASNRLTAEAGCT